MRQQRYDVGAIRHPGWKAAQQEPGTRVYDPALGEYVPRTDPATEERPFNTTLTDVRGSRWHFCYWGTEYVYVREMSNDREDSAPVGAREGLGRWHFRISLADYAIRPADVTQGWVTVRAEQWIADRNARGKIN